MVSPAKASYSSDSEDNIPLSQIKSPVSRRLVRRAEFDPMEEEEQEAAEKEGFYNSEIDDAEDSDLGYKPRSTVRSRNRTYVPSSDDDDDSSDGRKKPAAKPVKKSKR